MSLVTLIIVNATLAAAVVYGVVALLAFGIRTDRVARPAVMQRTTVEPSSQRLAA